MDSRQVARDHCETALEKTPSEIDLDNVSKRVGGDSSLLVHLGVPVDKIKSLSKQYRNPEDACFFGLVYWRDGNVRNKPITWSVLLEALEEGGERKDYARKLRKNIVNITNKAEQRQQSVEDDSPTLKGILSDKDLKTISKKVNGDWRSFLTRLGLPATEIRTLREIHGPDPTEVCLHGLVFWREGNHPCRPATWHVLCEALKKGAEKREYARELKKDIASKHDKECSQGPSSSPPPLPVVDERSKEVVAACPKFRASKLAVAALIAGSGLTIAGGVVLGVGGGLLLGGVSAPAGVALLGVGTTAVVGGRITLTGATIGVVVNNRRALKQICKGNELSRESIIHKKGIELAKKLWQASKIWKKKQKS